MYYFMIINGAQIGPFERDALLANGLMPDVYVWRDGMIDWMKARDMLELNDLLRQVTPPPMPKPITTPPPAPREATQSVAAQQPNPYVQSALQSEVTPVVPTNNQPGPGQISSPYVQPEAPTQSQTPAVTPTPTLPDPSHAGLSPFGRQRYYLNINGAVTGPFDKIELTRQDFSKDSMLATTATPDSWVKAIDIPEIAALIDNRPMAGARQPQDFYVAMSDGVFNTTNAHLLLFDDYIVTVPQGGLSVLFGNTSKSGYVRRFFGLEEIVGLKKGFAARKFIQLSGDRKLVIGYNNKSIFDSIIQRQNEFFASLGIAHTPIQPQ